MSDRPPRRFATVLAFVVALAALGFTSWIVVPAPALPLLALGVVAPEVPGWGLAACGVAVLAVWALARGPMRSLALGIVALAALCAALPLAALPEKLSTLAALFPPSRSVPSEVPFVFDELVAPFAAAPRARREYGWVAYTGAPHVEVFSPVAASYATDRRFAVVLIHGGAWLFGSWRDERELARRLVRLGYVALAVDYPLAPATRFPVASQQIGRVLDAVAGSYARLGIDPSHVAVLGESAGAELALLEAQRDGELHTCATIGYFAPTDLLAGYEHPPRPDPANVRRLLTAYLGGPPASLRDAYVAASPALRVRPGFAPTLLLMGLADEIVAPRFQREMADALRAAADPVATLELPLANHAFDAVPDGLDGRLGRVAVERFLGREFASCGKRPVPRPGRGPGGRPSDQ